jgi:hypothetical protein
MDLAQLQFTMDHRVTIKETTGALIVHCVLVRALSVYQFSSICLDVLNGACSIYSLPTH